MTDSNTIRFC